MSTITQDEKNFLSMAGEFLVAGELLRRKILAAVTYGTAKSADVWTFVENANRAVQIEVKTTTVSTDKWVVGDKSLTCAVGNADIFWVLVILPSPGPDTAFVNDEHRGVHAPRFFVLSSDEIRELVCGNFDRYKTSFLGRNNKEFIGKPVHTLKTHEVEEYENAWHKIVSRVRESAG